MSLQNRLSGVCTLWPLLILWGAVKLSGGVRCQPPCGLKLAVCSHPLLFNMPLQIYMGKHGTAAPLERDWNAAIIARIDVPASQLPSLTRLFKESNEQDLRRPLAVANDRNISAPELSIGTDDPKKYSSEQGVWDVCPPRRQHFKPFHRCYKYRQFFKLPEPSAHQILEDFRV